MIYALASEAHYRSHLAPVVQGLGASFTEDTHSDGALWLVSGFKDLKRLPGRRVVLLEHGAGQSYGTTHGSYAGGTGRENAVLFVCPNEQAAKKNRDRYPSTPAVVTGSPRVEQLRELAFEPEGAVAITFHWNADAVAPEAHFAYPHYRDVLGELAAKRKVIGHAHPRIAGYFRKLYPTIGIEWVDDFSEIAKRADLLIADNTSAMFEFAALGRPVVVLNAPWYRRDVNHGGRFWDWADVGIQVDEPEELEDAVEEALADPPAIKEMRLQIVEEIYPYDDAIRRTIEAIEEVNDERRDT